MVGPTPPGADQLSRLHVRLFAQRRRTERGHHPQQRHGIVGSGRHLLDHRGDRLYPDGVRLTPIVIDRDRRGQPVADPPVSAGPRPPDFSGRAAVREHA